MEPIRDEFNAKDALVIAIIRTSLLSLQTPGIEAQAAGNARSTVQLCCRLFARISERRDKEEEVQFPNDNKYLRRPNFYCTFASDFPTWPLKRLFLLTSNWWVGFAAKRRNRHVRSPIFLAVFDQWR